jgi:hypothetical protein
MTIEMKNDQPPSKEDRVEKIVKVYVNNRPRILGLLHVLDLSKASVNELSSLMPFGFIWRAIMCDCMAPQIPFHIKPVDRCVYVRLGRWFITVKYW